MVGLKKLPRRHIRNISTKSQSNLENTLEQKIEMAETPPLLGDQSSSNDERYLEVLSSTTKKIFELNSSRHSCSVFKESHHQAEVEEVRERLESQVQSIKSLTARVDDCEVKDRQMDSKLQMMLEQQNKLIHQYCTLDRKYRDVSKENKILRSEFNDLKKRFDYANSNQTTSPSVILGKQLKLGSFSSNISCLDEI